MRINNEILRLIFPFKCLDVVQNIFAKLIAIEPNKSAYLIIFYQNKTLLAQTGLFELLSLFKDA